MPPPPVSARTAAARTGLALGVAVLLLPLVVRAATTREAVVLGVVAALAVVQAAREFVRWRRARRR